MNSKLLGHLACFIAYSIFGINIIVCKDLMGGHFISPMAIFCLRSIGAGLLFWFLSFFLPTEKIERKDYVKIFGASVLGFFLTQITFLIAIPDITPMDCSIVSAISPILTMFIAAFALKEPITMRKAGGVALSFFGIIFLILNSVSVSDSSRQTSIMGILLIIANCLSFSLYLGLFKPLIARYSVVTFMKWIFLFSTLFSLPFAGKEILTFDYSTLSATYVSELAYLIICATFVTYFLIPVGQKRIRPTLVSMYSYVQPIIATTISICLGMDTLGWQKVLAALMVFSGVMMVNFSRSAKG